MPSRADSALARALPLLLLTSLASTLPGCAGRPAPAVPGVPASAPWEVPASALGTQRLYRVGYDGPEGEGSFRITLRFATPERYQLQAVDPLGRALFTLDVAAGEGLLLNHRSRSYCRFTGSFETESLPLGPFPLVALPTLLLGRLPAAPAVSPALGRNLEFVDSAGRTWTVAVDPAGAPLSWSLRDGETPSVWWARRDGWSVLSDRGRGVQIRWREVVVEPLPGGITRPEVPAGYREGACGAPDLPASGEAEPPRPGPGRD